MLSVESYPAEEDIGGGTVEVYGYTDLFMTESNITFLCCTGLERRHGV